MKNPWFRWTVLVSYVSVILLTLSRFPRYWYGLRNVLGRPKLYLLSNSLIIIFALVCIVVIAVKYRPSLRSCLIAAPLGIYYMVRLYSLVTGPKAAPAEALHLAEYCLLGGLAVWAFRLHLAPGWTYFCATILCQTVGVADETIQAILPNRTGELRDILLNWEASFIGLASLFILTQLDRRLRRRPGGKYDELPRS
ncbi:VanZ family protein [Candidatus Hydrogenedentota bacterium]